MRILCLSDTHGYHEKFNIDESVDVVVHTGDFSNSKGKNNIYETEEFLSWYNSLNIKHKILVAGNHDTVFGRMVDEGGRDEVINYLKRDYSSIIYLQDSSITIDGVKFYGTPWCPIYNILFFSGVIIFIVLLLLIMYLSYRIYGSFMEKKYDKVILFSILWVFTLIGIPNSGKSDIDRFSYNIDSTVYRSDYKSEIINKISKHSGYNIYKIINLNGGEVVELSENEYLKLNCKQFNIKVFEEITVFHYIFYNYEINRNEYNAVVNCY